MLRNKAEEGEDEEKRRGKRRVDIQDVKKNQAVRGPRSSGGTCMLGSSVRPHVRHGSERSEWR